MPHLRRLLTILMVPLLVGTVSAAAPTTSDGCAQGATAPGTYRDSTGTSTMAVEHVTDDCRRTYSLDTDAGIDRWFTEPAGTPVLRTGSVVVDSLYALAVEEARQNEVAEVSDAAYAGGAPIACPGGCYQTGADWTYVWTRDAAYAADLGLAALNPLRTRNTLLFKLSDRRDGTGNTQIVQDTGTGGSYPNSTDRVVWAQAAGELLDWLPAADRASFAAQAYEAIRNTIEHDRRVVYDTRTGLYRGEQSFLDWRQQSYPQWTADDVAYIATSEALSTNVNHWMALDAAANLARDAGYASAATTYRAWADALTDAIRDRLWLPAEGQFSQMLTTELDRTPVRRYDALGTALAVVTGIATPEQARSAIANYPQTPWGPPVLAPQEDDRDADGGPAQAYHNKGIWPFVTAYLARAAAVTDNDGVSAASFRSLVRGAALHGSHMENMDLTDGGTGTRINSERQLWSVAGMLSLIQHTTFGVDARPDGLHIAPFLPAQIRHEFFPDSSEIALSGIAYRGKRLDVTLTLPPDVDQIGAYTVTAMTLDGRHLDPRSAITEAMLGQRSDLVVTLGWPDSHSFAARTTSLSDRERLYAPAAPVLRAVRLNAQASRLMLDVDLGSADPTRVSLEVLRDGQVIESDVRPGSGRFTWEAPGSTTVNTQSSCYSLRMRFASTGNTSQHAEPVCYWGQDYQRVLKATADALHATGGELVSGPAGAHYRDWGTRTHDQLSATFTPERTGRYKVQAQASLGIGVESGVASGVKRVDVREVGSDVLVTSGIVVLPNTGGWDEVRNSTFVDVQLRAGVQYRVTLLNDRDAVNMSYFRHNARYDATAAGPANYADIYAIQLLLMSAS
ncbi:hypothetical protein ASE38_01625 [Cellulomonas sp. Root930]|nr:hypothetical protein ASE38_01625 [Cellulomonas sp. Root930]